jgi:membrane associated rhomboid family serine protease
MLALASAIGACARHPVTFAMAERTHSHERGPELDPDRLLRPVPMVTWTLAGSLVAVFVLQLAAYRQYGYDVVGQAFAFSPQALHDHRYWTLLTYAWAHAVDIFGYPWFFWLHIGVNLMSLIWFGPAVEEMLGRWRYLGLYLGGAVAAALVWMYMSPPALADQGIVGASGAVYAVIAALGVMAPSDWELVVYPFVVPLGRRIRLVVFIICAAEMLPLFFDWMPDVAHWAHLGGAGFGFLYVMALRRSVRVVHLTD